MILAHYTDAKPWEFRTPERGFGALYSQRGSHAAEIGKPDGLWLSVDGEDDWAAWCVSESFCPERLAQRHLFELADPERVLHIKTVAELDEFNDRFRDPGARSLDFNSIRWGAVAQQHAGIIIAPYQWQRRMHLSTRWYYSWDCASGCVWDLSALRFLRTEPGEAIIKAREAAR